MTLSFSSAGANGSCEKRQILANFNDGNVIKYLPLKVSSPTDDPKMSWILCMGPLEQTSFTTFAYNGKNASFYNSMAIMMKLHEQKYDLRPQLSCLIIICFRQISKRCFEGKDFDQMMRSLCLDER